MASCALVALVALALSACANPIAPGAAAGLGLGVYCNGLTEAARVEIRSVVTGGVKVINCPAPPAVSP